MQGRDLRAVENELFLRNQAHARSAFPRQPWESQGMLCIFDPIQAAFPLNLSLPYQGPQPGPGPLAPPSQPTQGRPSVRPNLPCQAWTRAVKAKRGSGSNDKRAEAHGKVLTLLHAFSSFFDLCQLMEEDEETGHNSVQAVLATRAPTTILKHVGPLRTFCEWLAKSGGLPPFPEKIVWSFVHCVLKMPRTAASTLDTCLKAIKWSYYALGLKVQLDVFQSARINGLAAKALQNKSPWDPASPLQVSEVLQLHAIASDATMSLIIINRSLRSDSFSGYVVWAGQSLRCEVHQTVAYRQMPVGVLAPQLYRAGHPTSQNFAIGRSASPNFAFGYSGHRDC